ncbi:ABC transporter ATP-binding protein [Actinoplanes sp. NBRC 103695]|uniref:ATP-binding cassette domain-containing protein n=1 Tax=Actinoplanes sp. NBRC 103695 TaxID=3032202 RepID=UPI0024A0C6EC|nr:ABC transporter ATP-binding protein [Actinoplanes sp. NBRC 103695]GLY93954.1 ABC transporter ATP-binding protein [Actinoplanes sp. NBRC 103695]
MTTTFRAVLRRGGVSLWLFGSASLAGSLVALAMPAVLGHAVDATVAGDGGRWVVLAAALIALGATAEAVESVTTTTTTASGTAWLRNRLVRHLLAIGPDRARRFEVGDLVSRVSGNSVEAAYAGVSLVAAVTAALPPLGSLVLLTTMDLTLGAAFLAGSVLCGLVLRAYARRTADVVTGYQHVQGRLAALLTEALAGSRTIAAAGTLTQETDRILTPLPDLHRHGRATWEVLSRSVAQAGVAGPAVLVVVLIAGGLALTAGRISPGELFAAGQYAVIGAGLGQLTGVFGQIAHARAGGRRADEVLAVEPVRYGDRSLPEGPGRLRLRGVSVRDEEQTLLDGIDLDLPGGATVAVVGASGAGKSVLAGLAARLRDPDAGEVLLDGVPLSELSHAALREAVGCAFERPVLVGESVAAAIGARRPAAEVRAAARAVYADAFVSRLPEGYDTPLARAPMSGGEAQRLGLARAWHARRLMVLDDATSSLDMVTEMQVTAALTGPAPDGPAAGDRARTRLLMTHRAHTAARSDLVVWLESGRVRAVGRHDELWLRPEYRAVFGTTAGEPDA